MPRAKMSIVIVCASENRRARKLITSRVCDQAFEPWWWGTYHQHLAPSAVFTFTPKQTLIGRCKKNIIVRPSIYVPLERRFSSIFQCAPRFDCVSRILTCWNTNCMPINCTHTHTDQMFLQYSFSKVNDFEVFLFHSPLFEPDCLLTIQVSHIRPPTSV